MPADLSQVVPFETGDGSITLYDEQRDVHYRSYHGAVSESRHVFLGGTALVDRSGPWRVAELGLGAAVNLTETIRAFRAATQVPRLTYHTVDWRPVTAEHLRFHDGEGGDLARNLVRRFHEGAEEVVRLRSDDGAIELVLHACPFEEADFGDLRAQAFYHDPFSKRVNPEGWTTTAFLRARRAMDQSGRLATYSAATSVKRAMFEAGFVVATAAGPGKKREMTIASPSRKALEGLELLDRHRYVTRS